MSHTPIYHIVLLLLRLYCGGRSYTLTPRQNVLIPANMKHVAATCMCLCAARIYICMYAELSMYLCGAACDDVYSSVFFDAQL